MDFIVINLDRGIRAGPDEADHVVGAIVDLGDDLANGVVFCAHVVHHKNVAIHLGRDTS